MDGGGSPHQQRRPAALIRPHRGRCVKGLRFSVATPAQVGWRRTGRGANPRRRRFGQKGSAALSVNPNAAAVAREVGGVSGVGVWRIAQVEGIELTHSYRTKRGGGAARLVFIAPSEQAPSHKCSSGAPRRMVAIPAMVVIRTTPHAAGTVLGLQCEDDLGIGRKHYTRPNSYQGECHSCGCEICAHGQ